MIPKIIHYCWFGRNPLPALAVKCIESWRKYFPDYEIKEWNEENFDVNIIPYTQQAYSLRKYAFVSDYARFWILYNYGGIYFDTDVEVIKSMDDLLSDGPFMGFEQEPYRNFVGTVNPGLGLAMTPKHPFLKEMLERYKTYKFISDNGKAITKPNVVQYTTMLLKEKGLSSLQGNRQIVAGITIYPKEFFSPICVVTNRIVITDSTRTVHRYAGSWVEGTTISFKQKLRRIFPARLLIWYSWFKNHRKE